MREFRGKCTDGGNWVYGVPIDNYIIGSLNILRHDDDVPASEYPEIEYDRVIPETIGQFTGLTDKNGVKIFEGDIVKGVFNTAQRTGVIVWINEIASFGVRYHSRETPTAWENSSILMRIQRCQDQFAAEIIGNTHDNPELLK